MKHRGVACKARCIRGARFAEKWTPPAVGHKAEGLVPLVKTGVTQWMRHHSFSPGRCTGIFMPLSRIYVVMCTLIFRVYARMCRGPRWTHVPEGCSILRRTEARAEGGNLEDMLKKWKKIKESKGANPGLAGVRTQRLAAS